MAENNQKKKRFIYKSVVGGKQPKPKIHEPAPPLVDFPDDFDSFTQPSKKAKLDLEKPKLDLGKSKLDLGKPKMNLGNEKKKNEGGDPENLFNDLNFEDEFDDDFDLNEIDQIEIAASQQLGIQRKSVLPPMPRVDVLDQLLEDTQSHSKFSNSARKSKFTQPSDRPGCSTSKSNSEHKNSTVYLPLSQKMDMNRNKVTTPQENGVHSNGTVENKELEKSFQKQYHQAQKTLTEYKSTVDNLQKKFNSKDGEIKILREKLRKSSEDELKMKERLVLLEGSSKTEQSKKEHDLVKEVEKLKTQLKFKEQEVKDAIQKQKQLEKPKKVAMKSPPCKETSNIPDGFRDECTTSKSKSTVQSGKVLINNGSTCAAKPTTKNIDRTKWTKFNISLQSNTHFAKFSNEMIKKLSSLPFDYSFAIQQPNYQCRHPKNTSPPDSSTFLNDIQHSLELIEQREYFISEFIRKVEHHLHSLNKLFESQSEKAQISPSQRNDAASTKTTITRKYSDSVPCLHCTNLYEIGLKTLFILKESCLAYSKVCVYLLSCFLLRKMKAQKTTKKSEGVIHYNIHYNTITKILVHIL